MKHLRRSLILFFASLLTGGCDASLWTKKERPKDRPQVHNRKDEEVEVGLDESFQVLRIPLKQAFKKYSRDSLGRDYLQAAKSALEVEDYWSAETLLTEAIKQDPNNGVAYRLRGRARFNAIAGADQAALDDLNKAVSLGAGDADVYKYIARIYDSKHETNRALAALDMAVKLEPTDTSSYKYRAALRVAVNKLDLALEDYDKVLSFNQANLDMRFLRAQLLERMGKDEAAIADYKKVVGAARYWRDDRLSLKGMAFRKYSSLLGKLGRYKEGVEVLTQAMQTEERDDLDELLRLRGQHYSKMKKYDLALADLNKSIALAPEFAREAYEIRAETYDKLGKPELAAKDRAESKRLRDKPAEKPVFDYTQN